MKIPVNATIAREKLTHYLLVPKPKNDKSVFLAQVGFTTTNPDALEKAIRRIIIDGEAIFQRENQYGTFYQVKGNLSGPDGIIIVITIWIFQKSTGAFRFVTLKPAR